MRPLPRLLLVTLLLAAAWSPAALSQAPQEGPPPEAPVALPALLERATLAAQAGDARQAILDFSLLLLFNPTFDQAWQGRARSHEQAGDDQRALQDYGRALTFSVTPERQAAVLHDRARLYQRQNRNEAALRDLDAAIEIWPGDVNSRLTRARLLTLENRSVAALADYEALLELLPDETGILLERGYFHWQRGATRAASRDFDAAVALAPQDAGLRAERAVFHANTGQYDAALTDLDEALRLEPENAGFWLLRGTLLQGGDEGAAAAAFLQWLQLIERETLAQPGLPGRGGVTTVTMQPGHIFIFPFAGRAGDRLQAGASSVIPGQVDPLLLLTDDAGVALVANDDAGDGLDARIDAYVLPRDGGYRLVVGHAAGQAQGELRVSLALE